MKSEQKRQFWQQHIEGWRQSQLPQRAYCKQQELSFSSFTYWRNRLKRLAEGSSKLLPVSISRTSSVAIFLPNGIRLEAPCHTLEEVLPVLVRAVQESR